MVLSGYEPIFNSLGTKRCGFWKFYIESKSSYVFQYYCHIPEQWYRLLLALKPGTDIPYLETKDFVLLLLGCRLLIRLPFKRVNYCSCIVISWHFPSWNSDSFVCILKHNPAKKNHYTLVDNFKSFFKIKGPLIGGLGQIDKSETV